MKKLVLVTIVCLFTAFKPGGKSSAAKKQPCLSNFDGKAYQYNVTNTKPDWTFFILFYCEGDSLRGAIMGPVIQNNARALFFRAIINNLQIKGDSIGFNFIPGELYRVPFTLRDYNNYGGQGAVGFSQERLVYKGIIQGDTVINLKCQNKYYACSVDSIVFRKK